MSRQSRQVRSRAAVVRPAAAAVIEGLEGRRLLAAPGVVAFGQPQLDAFANASVPQGHTLQVPVVGFDADGDAINYSVTSDNPAVVPVVQATSRLLQIDVAGFGRLEFALYDATPLTSRTIGGFADSGLYDGLTFHRVLDGFVNQGGDPAGDGSGSNVPDEIQFEDEFVQDLLFTGAGQLAMANSGKDTNTTQFFVTDNDSTPRFLDYNHTIFGQLVSGFDVNEAISAVEVEAGGRPAEPVVIDRARTVPNTTDAVVQLRGAGAAGSTARITVTAADAAGESSSQSFTASVVPDVQEGFNTPNNEPPILVAPMQDRVVPAGQPIVVDFAAIDPEGDDFELGGQFVTSVDPEQFPTSLDQQAKQLTLTPPADYVGPIELILGVKQAGATTRGSTQQNPPPDTLNIFDTQQIILAVGDQPISAAPAAGLTTREGVALEDVLLGTFVDPDPAARAADYTARIKWGDATFDFGTVTAAGNGAFEVRGSHTYGLAHTALADVEIVADGGATADFTTAIEVEALARILGSRLLVNGTDGDDILGVSNPRQGVIRANVNNVIRDFSNAGIDGVELRAFGGDDFVSIGGNVPPVGVDGGAGDDEIYGGEFADFIDAGEGNDYVFAAGGNDAVRGQGGRDTLTGGAGKNTLAGGDGDDLLNGSGARDELYGEEGQDRLYGGGGGDVMDGGGGIDRLFAGDGEDLLIGGGANDRLYGDFGNDTLIGGNGRDLFSGGDGTDTAFVNNEDDLDPELFFFSIEVIA